MYTHFCSLAKVGSMKDGRTRCHEYLVLQGSPGNMCVGTNQGMIANRASMTTAAADHCVLHNDAVCSDADPSPALTDEAGSVQNAGPRSNDHVTAYGGVGCCPSGGCYLRMFARVSEEKWCFLHRLVAGGANCRFLAPLGMTKRRGWWKVKTVAKGQAGCWCCADRFSIVNEITATGH